MHTDTGLCATIWDTNIIALSDDWTVAGGSVQDLALAIPHPNILEYIFSRAAV